ncbi:MAG: hypothetical protein ACRDQ6_19885, partial [Pseudonocardiaceae bacterium]
MSDSRSRSGTQQGHGTVVAARLGIVVTCRSGDSRAKPPSSPPAVAGLPAPPAVAGLPAPPAVASSRCNSICPRPSQCATASRLPSPHILAPHILAPHANA